jgi:long-chain acyl-CoA synthetase
MNFLEGIFARLDENRRIPVLGEVGPNGIAMVTGGELLAQADAARQFLRERGLRPGDQCVLLAANGIRWVALDLALLAEGIISVPLYYRQEPAELAVMIRDSGARHVCCGDETLRAALRHIMPDLPASSLLAEAFSPSPAETALSNPVVQSSSSAVVTLIYTSGTSGEPKGVMLSSRNVGHMLECTTARLDLLMPGSRAPERIFHYLPFSFAASWILLLSALSRDSLLLLSTDLNRLPEEIREASSDYFLNVPALLERMRRHIEGEIAARDGAVAALFQRAKNAAMRDAETSGHLVDQAALFICRQFLFSRIRKAISSNLKALICGSAPLSVETQRFFQMIGIPVLQAYGLTETTAICTMDDPRKVECGWVGAAIPGIEMKLGAENEILVRGPNVFSGYWNRPEETARVLRDGWLHTGDQGEINNRGHWRITGRLKDLVILNSGHNIAPAPMEDALLRQLPRAQQVMIVGNNRSYLAALVTAESAELTGARVVAAMSAVGKGLPHYRQIRGFRILPEPFSIANGLLTANGKLKRDAITTRFRAEIEDIYAKKS